VVGQQQVGDADDRPRRRPEKYPPSAALPAGCTRTERRAYPRTQARLAMTGLARWAARNRGSGPAHPEAS